MNNVLFPQTLSDLMHHSRFYGDMTSLSSFFPHKDGQLHFLLFACLYSFSGMWIHLVLSTLNKNKLVLTVIHLQ